MSINSFVCFFCHLAAKKHRSDKNAADEERRRATLETVLPDLLRTNQSLEELITDSQIDTGGPDEYLDLLLDEEEAFIREYRQRLINDGFGE